MDYIKWHKTFSDARGTYTSNPFTKQKKKTSRIDNLIKLLKDKEKAQKIVEEIKKVRKTKSSNLFVKSTVNKYSSILDKLEEECNVAIFYDAFFQTARKIATKVRELVPRSANRAGRDIVGQGRIDTFEGNEFADSYWEQGKMTDNEYITFQLRAMRSGTDVDEKLRLKVLQANKNLRYMGVGTSKKPSKITGRTPTPGRVLINQAFFTRMGWDLNEYRGEFQVHMKSLREKGVLWQIAYDKWFKEPQKSINKLQLKNEQDQACNEYQQVLQKVKSYKYGKLQLSRSKPLNFKKNLERDAKNTVLFKIGNCGECASLACVMMADYNKANLGKKAYMFKVALSGGGADHAFTLIVPSYAVPDPNKVFSNKAKPTLEQWEKRSDIIICDPWWEHKGLAYKFHELKNKNSSLYDYIKKYKDNFQIHGFVTPGERHDTKWQKANKLDYYNMSNKLIWQKIYIESQIEEKLIENKTQEEIDEVVKKLVMKEKGKLPKDRKLNPLSAPPLPSRSGKMTNPTIVKWQKENWDAKKKEALDIWCFANFGHSSDFLLKEVKIKITVLGKAGLEGLEKLQKMDTKSNLFQKFRKEVLTQVGKYVRKIAL
jgi:hypothetical protein